MIATRSAVTGRSGSAHDLAITLGGVSVADHEQRSWFEHGEVQSCALHDFIEIHVGAMGTGNQRADALLACWRGADRPKELAEVDAGGPETERRPSIVCIEQTDVRVVASGIDA